ncbi:hypothetical protein XA68_16800 [Ophiocordyceps unilateralis]|uniref:Large ribosomal subunit protein mL50 n=1 Tax=Ophiocordyceps unilateralis TaxID=268505 RepID=A0A2A9PJF2_OPHUN|nr:hypothetical protein XA68_16800 [Ophiocordyceps unilateralis]
MPRLPGTRSLKLLSLAASSPQSATATPLTATCALTTTSSARSEATEWVRKKLWKGKPPGPKDPYAPRPALLADSVESAPTTTIELPPRRDRTPRPIKLSRLTVPPKRTEAATEAQAVEADPNYVPAEDGKGLEHIETLDTWWQRPGHWGEESQFKGFGGSTLVTDSGLIEASLRRAFVEVIALQQTGHFAEWMAKPWRMGGLKELRLILDTRLDTTGELRQVTNASAISQHVRNQAEPAEKQAAQTSEKEAKAAIQRWGNSWKKSQLSDEIKFAMRKRLYQLTGNLISDAKLGAASTIQHLLTVVAKAPKPKRLATELRERGDLLKLANVKVHSRRVGLITKETAVGRWKVIRKELSKRGIPARGPIEVSSLIEKQWLSGKV